MGEAGAVDGEYKACRRSPSPRRRPGATLLIAPTPAGHGAPILAATLGSVPEDFRVDERLPMTPDGAGEHLWLRIEKRLLNTADVLGLLERLYAVGSADVGVSGLKDRRAVTRQWFSVRTPKDAAVLETALARHPGRALRTLLHGVDGRGGDGATDEGSAGTGATDATARGAGATDAEVSALVLLEAARHSRKLRRGTHVANAFEIVLRDVTALGVDGRAPDGGAASGQDVADAPGLHAGSGPGFDVRLEARLEAIRTLGFPNYLGPQRFGHGGRNVERARAWFRAPRRRTSRSQRGLWLSAARSELFNRVCAARVTAGNWSTLLDGEPASLDGSRSFFVRDALHDTPHGGPSSDPPSPGIRAHDEASTDARLARGDIHPSGPWWGRGEPSVRGACAAFEREVLAAHADLREGLERAGLEQERRALRARPSEFRVEHATSGPDSGSHRDADLALDGVAEDGTLRLVFTLPPGTFATTLLAELGPCLRPDAHPGARPDGPL